MPLMLVAHPDEIIDECKKCKNANLDVIFMADWHRDKPVIPVVFSCSACGSTREDTIHLILVEDQSIDPDLPPEGWQSN